MTETKKRTRGRAAKRRSMLETPDLRWRAGKEPKMAKVVDRPFNRSLIKTEIGLVRVKDNKLFQKGLEIPVWVEKGTDKLICKGVPKQLDRWA